MPATDRPPAAATQRGPAGPRDDQVTGGRLTMYVGTTAARALDPAAINAALRDLSSFALSIVTVPRTSDAY